MPKVFDMYLAKLSLIPDLFNYSLESLLERVTSVIKSPGEPVLITRGVQQFWWGLEYSHSADSEFGELLYGYLDKINNADYLQWKRDGNVSVQNTLPDAIRDRSVASLASSSSWMCLQIFRQRRSG